METIEAIFDSMYSMLVWTCSKISGINVRLTYDYEDVIDYNYFPDLVNVVEWYSKGKAGPRPSMYLIQSPEQEEALLECICSHPDTAGYLYEQCKMLNEKIQKMKEML